MRITRIGGLELDSEEVIHSQQFKDMLEEVSRVFDRRIMPCNCGRCMHAALDRIETKYVVHLTHKGKIESYNTTLLLHQCLHCGYTWWDESLPDPILEAVRQYVALHGPEDSEVKHLAARFALPLDTSCLTP